MIPRVAKIASVAAVALFFTIVAFGNITDYGSNFGFVEHVLRMDTTFLSPSLMWRAIDDPILHHAAYWIIIAAEAATGVLCWWGVVAMVRAREHSARYFNRAKSIAVLGVTCGFLLYIVGFLVVGGEWFAMWQSKTWNGQNAAHIFASVCGLVLIFVSLPDAELGDA